MISPPAPSTSPLPTQTLQPLIVKRPQPWEALQYLCCLITYSQPDFMFGSDSEQACKILEKFITFDFGLNHCYLKA